MRIAVGIDHAGVPLREAVAAAITDGGHETVDLGEREDYPQIALAAARAIGRGDAQRAVLVCGSGAGVGIAASKLPGIRAQAIHDGYTAHQAVEHDGANVLCLGARVIGPRLAAEIVTAFAAAHVSDEERHVRRRAQVDALERDGFDAQIGEDGA
jgi:ribose 5-phosphate isomerase B